MSKKQLKMALRAGTAHNRISPDYSVKETTLHRR